MKRFLIAATLAAASIGLAGPALAHAKLVRSDPKAGAVVRSGPKSITLAFSERLVPAFSKFTLSMPAHKMDVPVTTVVSPDGKRIVGTLPARLTAGAYRVSWTAASTDGHKMTGAVDFKVG